MYRQASFLVLIIFSIDISANTNYKTPQEICLEYGVKDNGKLLKSIDDVSHLNKTKLSCIVTPKTASEVSEIIRSINKWNKAQEKVHISISGARHSQGGHIASSQGITLDMANLRSVSKPILKNGYWTVKAEAGAFWGDVHNAIRKHEGYSLANKVQQSSTPFTVGGTLSVNAHGRSFSYGSVIHSVEKITVVLPDGKVINASRHENPKIFKQVIGGYGLFGVIIDATLELNENHYLIPESTHFNSSDEYVELLEETLQSTPRNIIKRDKLGAIESLTSAPIAFLFATLSLDSDGFMKKGTSYSYKQRLDVDYSGTTNPDPEPTLFNFKAFATKVGFWLKRNGLLINRAQKEQYKFLKKQDTHLKMLTPPIKPILAASDKEKPDLLQEYFLPVKNMPKFLEHVKGTFLNNGLKLSNASLRFIPKTQDTSLLSYESATQDQLAIVLYFALELNNENISNAKEWTRNLVDKALALNGRYYLPYQQWPTKKQFELAYPNYKKFYEQKVFNDPNEVFSNRFYEFYLNSNAE